MVTTSRYQHLVVPVEKLYQKCQLDDLPFNTTGELDDLREQLGQARAMAALSFGVGIKHEGYNLYVLGSTGLGKHTTVASLLEGAASQAETPPDWCYVNNFEQHHKPRALKLPAGRGQQFRQDMQQLIEDL
ncbi:MAG TPA: Lon-like protease helical domain-containing protein, partial [Gammaproteobacteria bacterium]